MKAASSHLVRSMPKRRGVASTNVALVLAMCAAFAGMIAVGVFWSWQPTIVLPMTRPGSLNGLTLLNPADGFSDTRVGQLVYWPEAGNECRRVLYDNRTGMLQEAGSVACAETQPQQEPPPSEADRLTALRKAFQK